MIPKYDDYINDDLNAERENEKRKCVRFLEEKQVNNIPAGHFHFLLIPLEASSTYTQRVL